MKKRLATQTLRTSTPIGETGIILSTVLGIKRSAEATTLLIGASSSLVGAHIWPARLIMRYQEADG